MQSIESVQVPSTPYLQKYINAFGKTKSPRQDRKHPCINSLSSAESLGAGYFCRSSNVLFMFVTSGYLEAV